MKKFIFLFLMVVLMSFLASIELYSSGTITTLKYIIGKRGQIKYQELRLITVNNNFKLLYREAKNNGFIPLIVTGYDQNIKNLIKFRVRFAATDNDIYSFTIDNRSRDQFGILEKIEGDLSQAYKRKFNKYE